MKEISIETKLRVYDDPGQLSADDRALLDRAVAQLALAYAPYSKFHVGAAARLINGAVVEGANQENASYPLCMCGERVAIYHAASRYPDIAIETLAIVAQNEKMPVEKPVTPCGACRQVICEFESKQEPNIRILLKGDGPEIYEVHSGKALLPLYFDRTYLL